MKKIYKRVLALLLVCVIVSSTTYKAHAAATVPVVVSAGEAIAYVLGILGITAGAGYVIDKKDEITSWGSDQIGKLKEWTKTNSDKVNAWGAATSQEIESSIDAWFEKLRTGTLDTASAVWDSIKAWGGSIYDKLHTTDVPAALGGAVAWTPYVLHDKNSSIYWISTNTIFAFNVSNASDTTYHFRTVVFSTSPIVVYRCSGHTVDVDYIKSEGNRSVIGNGMGRDVTVNGVKYYCDWFSTDLDGVPIYPQTSFTRVNWFSSDSCPEAVSQCLTMSLDVPADEYISIGGVSDIFDRDKSLDNIGVAVPGIAAGATDIPIDWGLVGDIAGTLTDVRAGVKDIADALADAKVFPIDTTRDTVIDSDGDLSNDKAKDDVIPAVPNVGTLDDYKLAGLEKVFPFCIPFDLIAFLGCLSAAPEAPAFDWVFPLPGKDGKEYALHVDLSPWEPVAKIARTMETLAFCIGLVMITREKMIVS
jgi:hypothetical protein